MWRKSFLQVSVDEPQRAAGRGWRLPVALAILYTLLLVPHLATAQQTLGTLTADEKTLTWSPVDGTPVTGDHDRGSLAKATRVAFSDIFTAYGLRVEGQTTPGNQLELSIADANGNHARVVFTSAAGTRPTDLRWSSREAVHINKDDVAFGDIVTFDAATTIDGEVLGSVVAIGGDVMLSKRAAVRGDVIVIGGVLRQRPDAKIYGRVFAPGGHRRPRLFIPGPGELESRGYEWRPSLSYDRVDGLRLGVGGTLLGDNGSVRVGLWGGYALASETWQYRFHIQRSFFATRMLEAGVSLYRLTDTQDETVIGRDENTVYALVAGSDYRDYYGVDGGEAMVTLKYREVGSFSLNYMNEDYRPLDAEPNLWHLFRSGDPFRANFSTLGGMVNTDSLLTDHNSALRFTVRVAPVASGEHPIGFNGSASISYEVSGGALGGDYDYDRLTLDGLGWWDSGRWHKVAIHVFYGVGRRDLPPQKYFYSGGLGTLRGYGQKEFSGDQSLITNVEYHFKYWENPFGDASIILFMDAGRTSFDDDFLNFDDIQSDLGIGLDFGESIRLNAAKALTSSTRDVKVTLKLSRSF